MIKTALILAGGLGKRLRPLTYAVPKPLLPIGEKPIIEHIIIDMKEKGINNFLISVNYKKEMIMNYLKDGKSLGTNIEYVQEKDFTGTAGCLKHINTNEDIIISNGDILCNVDYVKLSQKLEKFDFIITTVEKEYKIDFGVLKFSENHDLIDWTEKPIKKYDINAGIYAIKKEIIEFIRNYKIKGEFLDMPDLWRILKSNGKKLGVFRHKGLWKDVGKMEDYLKCNEKEES